MYTAIAVLIVIASILLTIIVLVQNSKGGGLAANFASGNQTFGVRQTADFLEKTTWVLAITIIVLCVLATAFVSSGNVETKSDLKDKIENTAPAQAAPDFQTPASSQPAAAQPAATQAAPEEKKTENTTKK